MILWVAAGRARSEIGVGDMSSGDSGDTGDACSAGLRGRLKVGHGVDDEEQVSAKSYPLTCVCLWGLPWPADGRANVCSRYDVWMWWLQDMLTLRGVRAP